MSELGERLARLSPHKLELMANELERSRQALQRIEEPVAIIGMGCRFPGGVDSADELWSLLDGGRDARQSVPTDRAWTADVQDTGYFIDDAFRFDAELFGVSPRETKAIDPQHRLLLELTWQALEHAGYSPRGLGGTRTGLYVGCYGDDFAHQLVWSGDVRAADAHTSTGTSHSAAVGRVAHLLDLSGPAIAVDTACSSSLVSIHLACNALRRGECDTALAGGVSLALSAQTTRILADARMLAGDGRCKTFDAAADGYARGEGGGLVVLKRLSDAARSRDAVMAVIRGSAVNHDGRASSLTAPNGDAQADVIRQALDAAKLDPDDVQLVECHGTGTPLGDPVEVRALRAVFAAGGDRPRRLALGAVKSSIGHLEAAAGVAGVIKTVLAMARGTIPANLHLDTLNPELADDAHWIDTLAERRDWDAADDVRVAGISSFGFGGTNAHVILARELSRKEATDQPAVAGRVMTLSAADEAGVTTLARRYLDWFERGERSVSDACYTANVGRTPQASRAVVEADDLDRLTAGLRALSDGDTRARDTRHDAARPPSYVFMFTGQGSQYPDMGRALFENVRVFRDEILRCESMLSELLDVRLTELLYGNERSRLHHTRYAQPALFAFEHALSRIWTAAGVRPEAVIGHSVGEYVAALHADVFDLETGLRLVAERGRLMGSLPEGGAMIALACSADMLAEQLPGAELDIAAMNAADRVVVSGGETSIERIARWAHDRQIGAQRLEVSHAFHSARMDPVLDRFAAYVDKQRLQPPAIPLYSNLTGTPADTSITAGRYWAEHMRRTVMFSNGVKAATADGHAHFIEIGPGSTLAALARLNVPRQATVHTSLGRGGDDWGSLSRSLGEVWESGSDIDWSVLYDATDARRCAMPTYPFAGEVSRNRVALRGERRFARLVARQVASPLLGEPVRLAGSSRLMYNRTLVADEREVAFDHRLFGQIVVPGAYYVATALSIALQRLSGQGVLLENIQFREPLEMADGEERAVQTLCEGESGVLSIEVHSALSATDEYRCHASLRARSCEAARAVDEPIELDAGEPVSGFYRHMAEQGYGLGPRFRWLTDVRRDRNVASARLRAPTGFSDAPHHAPGYFDACFQLLAAATEHRSIGSDEAFLLVPAAVDSISVWPEPVGALVAQASIDIRQSTEDTLIGNIRVVDSRGRLHLRVDGLCVRRIDRIDRGRYGSAPTVALVRREWTPVHAPAADIGGQTLVVGAPDCDVRALETLLAAPRFRPALTVDALDVFERVVLFLPAVEPAAPDRILEDHIESILACVRALAACDGSAPRLHLVSRSGRCVNGTERVDPAMGALAGLARTLAFEHPELWGSLIDLDGIAPVGEAFVRALGLRAEHVVAVRSGELRVPRLAPHSTAASADNRPGADIRADRSYLVTGGMGALGQRVARWLIERGAARVVLVGRSPLNAIRTSDLEALRGDGSVVEYVAADIARAEALDQVLVSIADDTLPWHGCIHAAGVLDDALIVNQSWRRFSTVIAPKVIGACNLFSGSAAFEWGVLFSSVAALLGSPGQSNYAYANAYLDAFSHRLRSRGVRAVSINLGPFSEHGMAARSPSRRDDRIGCLEPDRIGTYIEAALTADLPCVGVADIDFPALSRIYPSPAFLTNCMPLAESTSNGWHDPLLDRERVLAMPLPERRQALIESMAGALSGILEVPVEHIDVDSSLLALGLDSLTSLEFKTLLEKAMGVPLAISQLLRGPSLAELAELVLAGLEAEEDAEEECAERDPQSAIEHLSDEQVAALLNSLNEESAHVEQ